MATQTGSEVSAELERTRCEFHALLDSLSPADWDAPSLNPAWTNGQLVYHVLFAFMLVPSLFWMIRLWSRLPRRFSRGFAALLDSSTPLFNRINALGPRGQERAFGRARAGAIYDRVHRSILRRVASLREDEWDRGMHYPRRWDPTFGDFMTFRDLLRYPPEHFRRHRRHLSAGRQNRPEGGYLHHNVSPIPPRTRGTPVTWFVPVVSSTVGWPALQLAVFFFRFHRLPPGGPVESLVFAPMGLAAGVAAAALLSRATSFRQRRLVVWGYLGATPIALLGSLLGGLALPNVWGPLVFGAVPLVIGCAIGFAAGRSDGETT